MKFPLSDFKKFFDATKYVLVFFVLLMSFHFFYGWWASDMQFYPFKTEVDNLFDFSSHILFNQSVWILHHIFSLDFTTEGQTIWVALDDGRKGYVEVSPGCTSLKQWMHWLFIMILFPGPWKHKLWYIPAGIVVIHFVNIIRIVGLSLTLKPWADYFDFFHDYIFKTFFYFMIFVMWALWVEIFLEKKKNKHPDSVPKFE